MLINVLIGCESSGVVREAFRRRGFNAWSCDLLPADDGSEFHIQGDLLTAINMPVPGRPSGPGNGWDLLIAHPPCTYLASSGLHWNVRFPSRQRKTEEALEFVRKLMAAPIPHIAIENPVGRIGTAIRPADQYIQPYEFGDDASKRTGLWLKNLPLLRKDPAQRVPGRIVTLPSGRTTERWANQTDSGQNRLPPSEDRWKIRSKTYAGIAEAMAEQWGEFLRQENAKAAPVADLAPNLYPERVTA